MEVVSQLLGYAIIAGSFALKIPQIMKILSSKSVVGLSFPMFVLEMFGFVFQGGYAYRTGVAPDKYMETFVILVQNFVIVYLMYRYTTGINAQAALLLGGVAALLAAQMTVMPMDVVRLLQLTTIPIFSASKVPQIIKAFADKSTGQLDLFMVTLQTLGSLARVFTSRNLDWLYLAGYIIGSTLSGIMLLQILVYGGSAHKATTKGGAAKDAQQNGAAGSATAANKSPQRSKKTE